MNSEDTMTEKRTIADWPRKTFTYGSVKVTVERRTAFDEIVYHSVLAALPLDDAKPIQSILPNFFALIVAHTVEVEGLDMDLPVFGATDEDYRTAFEAFQRMDAYLMDMWVRAIEDVNRPPNAKEFWPSHKLSEAERKNRASVGSPGKATSGASSESTTKKSPKGQ